MKLLVLALIGVACASQVRYDNFKVHRLFPQNEDQVEALKTLQDNGVYDFWSDGIGLNYTVDVMVPPHLEFNFQDFLRLKSLNAEVFVENVQDLIDMERAPAHPRSMGWVDYYDLDEVFLFDFPT